MVLGTLNPRREAARRTRAPREDVIILIRHRSGPHLVRKDVDESSSHRGPCFFRLQPAQEGLNRADPLAVNRQAKR